MKLESVKNRTEGDGLPMAAQNGRRTIAPRSPMQPKSISPHSPQEAEPEASRVMIRRDQQKKHSLLTDLFELTKPEISFVVAISAVVGFVLGSGDHVNWWLLFHTIVGVCLSSAGGAILNHYIERDLDKTMKRTARRPLAEGRLLPLPVLVLGLFVSTLGVAYVHVFVNFVTMILSAATIVLYVAVYTPLKRMTKYNTLVGTLPGALPALGGWTAATETIAWPGLLMLGLLVTWQMPHFLAIAWMYRQDYERGGFKMLSVVEPDGRSTVVQTVFYTALCVGFSLSLLLTNLVGMLYISGAVLLGSYFMTISLQFYRDNSHQNARKVLLASVMYIPLLLLCIVVDRLI